MKASYVIAALVVAGLVVAGAAAVLTAPGRRLAPILDSMPVRDTGSIDSMPSPAGPGAAEPSLSVAGNGAVYLSWLEPVDSSHALKVATFEAGQWSTPVTVHKGRDFFVNWADFPAVTALDSGHLAVHWLQRTGKGTYAYGVRIAQSADGGRTWSKPVVPHRGSGTGEHGFVAKWPVADGLGAAWLDSRNSMGEGHGGEMMLMSTTIAADGTLGPEVTVDSRTCDCCQNAVAMLPGGPIVAYRNRTADEIRDIYVSRLVNGAWTEGVPVHDDQWKIDACPVNGPAIVASDSSVAVAWFTGARDSNRVNVAFSTNSGATFGAPIRIDGGQPGGRVDLVRLDDGSVIVSWLERTSGDSAAVRARLVTAAGTMGEPKTIAPSSTARASGVPRMARSGSEIWFAWTVATRPSTVRIARASVADFR